MQKTVIIKWGGGLITEKSGLNELRSQVLERLAHELKLATLKDPNLRIILGHGAGSFGHPQALEWLKKPSVEAKKIVLESLGILRTHVMSALKSQGLNAHAVSASDFSSQADWVRAVREAFDAGFIPLFHGDIVNWDEEERIVSTEDLIALLPMPRSKIIFLMDEEGVMKDGKLVRALHPKDVEQWSFNSKAEDVTGGMAHKLKKAFELANSAPVVLASGLVSGRFRDELLDCNEVQTQIIKDGGVESTDQHEA